jgi:hypothetical protein
VLRKATRLAAQINMQAPETLENFSSVEAMRWRRYGAVTEGPAIVGDIPGLRWCFGGDVGRSRDGPQNW